MTPPLKLLTGDSPEKRLAKLVSHYGWECNSMVQIQEDTWRACGLCEDCQIRALLKEILK